jgi:glycosyltransferase involved in cell wall biosynthesis
MVMHLPPDRTLGGARIQVELAEHLRDQGHEVDMLTRDDVLGSYTPIGVRRHVAPRFAPRAVRHVRRLASKYDVVDAQQGNLTATKREMEFDGLLVARSVGLVPLYQEYMRTERRRWPEARHGTVAGRALRVARNRLDLTDALRSYAAADLLNVGNQDECLWLDSRPASRGKCVVLPYGISDARLHEFAAQASGPDVRLASPQVSCIGRWSLRKGSEDWPSIISRVRANRPGVRLRLLGTGGPAHGASCAGTEVIESYQSEELPSLLGGATVGVLPSYVEGFPFAVLEHLASGVPVVAYDAPGARETLRILDPSLLIPAGDTKRLAARVLDVLALDPAEYSRLSAACRALAGHYTWRVIASQTADIYHARLTAWRSL